MSLDLYRNKIICGDALSVLRGMPSESIQCCVTSPPYWGLRDYKTEPIVWGGSSECQHEWVDATYIRNTDKTAGLKQRTNIGSVGRDDPIKNAFCSICGAWLGSLGLEPSPDLYVAHLVEIFREVKRVLRADGTLWLNMGDSYAASGGQINKGSSDGLTGRADMVFRKGNVVGLKPKDLVGIPWTVAFALRDDGWYLRADIIWAKPNPMPESMRDRPTRSHEYIFMLSKSARYYFDQDAVREPASWERWGKQTIEKQYRGIQPIDMNSLEQRREQGRNIRSVWTIPTCAFSGAHFAVFPEALVEPMVKAGCPEQVCKKCGTPRERMMKRERGFQARRVFDGGLRGRRTGKAIDADYRGVGFTRAEMVGWSDCGCNAGWDSGVVLDPFVGSGTACLVAAKLNRDWIGIDVSPAYCGMARRRVAPYAVKLTEAFG